MGDQVAGRMQLLCSLFWCLHELNKYRIGPRRNWGTKKRSFSYRSRRDAGRSTNSDSYLTPHTKLRICATYTEDGNIKLVESVRSCRALWGNLESFRRSAYCVHKPPAQGHRGEGARCEAGNDLRKQRPSPALSLPRKSEGLLPMKARSST